MPGPEPASLLTKLPRPEIRCYYETGRKHYWMPDRAGHFVPLNKDDMTIHLAKAGWSRVRDRVTGMSETDLYLSNIQIEQRVDFAGQLAGHRPGFLNYDTLRILVTDAPDLLQPKAGPWPTIRGIMERLVGAGQLPYFLGWHQHALLSVHTEDKKPGQMLALAGPPGCGKSLWQNRIITPMLGNRVARPIQFMTGQTSFNEDVLRAEHLMLEDEHSSTDLKSRRAFGSAIKNFTVNKVQRMHPKGKTALNLPTVHRLTLSVNDEAENLAILPPLDESLTDKIILLKCSPAVEYSGAGLVGQAALEHRLVEELPGFVHYLLCEHVVLPEHQDERFGIRGYLNPELATAINGLAPETSLDDLIARAYFHDDSQELKASAADIQATLIDHPDTSYVARKLLSFPSSTKTYLTRLWHKDSRRYERPEGEDDRWTLRRAQR